MNDRQRCRALGVSLLAVVLFLMFLTAACAPRLNSEVATPSAESVVRQFYDELEAGEYEVAVSHLRRADGAALDIDVRTQIVSSWRTAWRGARFHIETIAFTASVPLPSDTLAKIGGASSGYQLTLNIDGSSDTACFPLPAKHVTLRTAELRQTWYLIQESPQDYMLRCRN